MLDELDEDTAGAAWMDERDAPVGPLPWHAVDQLNTLRLQLLKRQFEVADREGYVMERLPVSVEKPCNARIGGSWRYELELRWPRRQKRYLNLLVFDHLPVQGLET